MCLTLNRWLIEMQERKIKRQGEVRKVRLVEEEGTMTGSQLGSVSWQHCTRARTGVLAENNWWVGRVHGQLCQDTMYRQACVELNEAPRYQLA